MRITKINDTQLKIENSQKGLELLDVFDILENMDCQFKIDIMNNEFIRYAKVKYSINNKHFDNLMNCNSIVLNKLERIQ